MTAMISPTRTTERAPAGPAGVGALPARDVLQAVSALVADLPVDADDWSRVGRRLTAVVDAVRQAVDGSRSPISLDEDVAPVLRLRDLARTSQRAVGVSDCVVPAGEVTAHLAALAFEIRGEVSTWL